jgi:predicted nucleic acid-binding Zn ribbon protein
VKKHPQPIADVLATLLKRSGIARRVDQASVIPDWPGLVGEQIAAVTLPTSVTADGTLFVRVTTNAWMSELSLLEPELLKALNARPERVGINRIRWQLGA